MKRLIAVATILLGSALMISACGNQAHDEEDVAEVEQGLGSCTVTRYCDYPPPTYVTCTSATGNCVLGLDYVECDGNEYLCSSPPQNCGKNRSKCIGGISCLCSNECGGGTCWNGTCNCDI
jgi:hypothetical protein